MDGHYRERDGSLGNWSCLYHWLEFRTPSDAEDVHTRLKQAEAFYKTYLEAAADKWAVRFGFLTDTTLQLVSSQKWGMAEELAHWASEAAAGGHSAIVQAGIDRYEQYTVYGSPRTAIPVYDRLYFIDWRPRIENGRPSNQSPALVELEQPITFSLAHFDPSDMPRLGSGAGFIEALMEAYQARNSETEKRVAFGRNTPQGVVFLGELYLERDDFVFQTTGCYNPLSKIVQLGPYQTPIEDEPGPLVL